MAPPAEPLVALGDRLLGRPRCSPFLLLPDLPDAGEPDRDRRAVRALGRPRPRLCRHRHARPCDVLRPRRLCAPGSLSKAGWGEPLLGARCSPAAFAGAGRLRRELPDRARAAPRADHDHARARAPDLRARQRHDLADRRHRRAARASTPGRCFGAFRFDLWGYTAYGYALAVLFVGFLAEPADRAIRPSGWRCAASARTSGACRRSAPTTARHLQKIYTISAAHGRRGRGAADPDHRHRVARHAELPALGRRGGHADPRRHRPALRRASSGRSSSCWRATSSPA